MAESCIQDYATALKGGGAAPSFCSSRCRHSGLGFGSVCQEQIASALDVHMINVHLELGQLWRCPVEWCAVWKGSVSDCLRHLQDKHGGSQ